MNQSINPNKIGLILIAVFWGVSLSAQQNAWVDAMYSPSSNFGAVQQQFNSDWNGIDYVRGNGWKQFHRWEEFWGDRLLADGSFPDFRVAYKEYKEYQQLHGLAKNGQNGGDWSPLGPFGYTSTQSWSPGLGRVNFITEDPNNSNIIYLGTPAGGVWKSTNAGSSWTPLGDDLAVIGVSGIAVSHQNSNVLYISTGDADGGDTYSIGVMKSLDGGQTWNSAGNLNGNLRDMLIDPTNSDIVYVCSDNGVFKTTNGGNSWNSIFNGAIRDLEMKPGVSQTIYAASASQVFYSTNGGGNWYTASGIPSGGSRIVLAVTPADNGYVYALRANGNSGYGGIYRSTNSGMSFVPRNTTTDVFDGSNQAWYDLALCVSSTDPNTIFTGVLNVWKSTNGGSSLNAINSWSNPAGAAYTHADIHFLRYYGGNFYCGSDGGIYKSTNNGSSFSDLSDGLQIGQFYRIGGSPNDVNTIAGGLQDNGGFVWNNNSWKVYYGADGMEAAVNPFNSNNVYGMIQMGNLYRTTNGGYNLQTLGSPQTGLWVTPMQHDPNVSDRIIAGYDDLYEYNGGWNQLSNYNFPGKIKNIEIYDGNSQVIYVSTNSTIYRTTNNGANFTNVSGNLSSIVGGNSITSIEVDPVNSNRVWVSISGWSAGNKIAYTSNGGASWSNVSGTLPNLPCNIVKLETGSASTNALYVGMDIGVYYRDDAIGDFIPFMTNLPNVIVRDLEINEANGVIRAGTYGRGVWESGVYSNVAPTDDAGVSAILSPNGMFCGETFTPKVMIKNFGGNALTQVDIHYQIDAGTVFVFNWTGNLAPQAEEEVTLPTITQGGTHVFKAWTQLVGGAVDGDASNDMLDVSYTGVLNGGMVYTSVIEDCWGAETTWEIKNDMGVSLINGGPYVSQNPLTLHQDSICLNYGCYDFIINDGYGDGVGGSQHSNCNDDGNYFIISEFGDTVVNMPVADFGYQAIHNFCVATEPIAEFGISASSNCAGSTVTFTDASSNATSWAWDFGTGASPATANGAGPHDVIYSSGGVKTVTLTINGGSYNDVQTYTVDALPGAPTVTTSGSTTFCDGGTVNLTSSQISGNVWSTGGTSSSIAVSSAGSYSVTYTDNNGCSATSLPTDVTVNPLPIITAGLVVDPTTCSTATGSIEVAGSGTGTLNWSGVLSGSQTNVALPYTINSLSAGTYAVSFVDANGCGSNTISQTLNDPGSPAIPVITANGPLSFCAGGSVVLSSSANVGNVWTNGGATNSITVTTSGSYEVTVTDNAGCSSTSLPTSVVVNALPSVPVITVNGPESFCEGESVELTSSYASGNTWSTSETSASIIVTNTGIIEVTHTDVNGCYATSMPIGITVTPLPMVSFGAIEDACVYHSLIEFTQGAPSGGVYSGVGVSGTQFDPATAGIGTHVITYTYTDINGCEDSATSTIIVDGCVGLDEQLIEWVKVYPNPTSNELTIKMKGEFTYQMLDVRGRLVAEGTGLDMVTMNTVNQESGVYMLQLSTDTKSAVVKVVKE